MYTLMGLLKFVVHTISTQLLMGTLITYISLTVAHILALLYLDVVCLPELLRCYPGVKREENLKFQATRGIIGSKKLKSAFARNE